MSKRSNICNHRLLDLKNNTWEKEDNLKLFQILIKRKIKIIRFKNHRSKESVYSQLKNKNKFSKDKFSFDNQ